MDWSAMKMAYYEQVCYERLFRVVCYEQMFWTDTVGQNWLWSNLFPNKIVIISLCCSQPLRYDLLSFTLLTSQLSQTRTFW